MKTILVAFALFAATASSAPLPEIIGEMAARTTAIMLNQKPVIEPTDGCAPECTCNGTGREKTGDGLDTVDCRCDDNCKCKPALVPIKETRSSGRVVCEGGVCYWIDNVSGEKYRVVK